MDIEKQYEWSKKGKKYRTRYLDELKKLYNEVKHDKDCQQRSDTNRAARTDSFCGVVEEAGV